MATATTTDFVYLHPDDNIVVAARPLTAGTRLDAPTVSLTLHQDVPMGHKIAIRTIKANQAVLKYGQTIGFADCDIEPGDWVHTHNVVAGSLDALRKTAPGTSARSPEPITDCTFLGYRRGDGRVGTRNYIAVISTVNCSASVSRYIAARFGHDQLREYPNVDGVFGLTHKSGCGMPLGGATHQQLSRVLAGFARHPNVGAYLLVGLGCEIGTAAQLIEDQGLVQLSGPNTPSGAKPGTQPPVVLSIQDCGGVARTVERGVAEVARMLPRVNEVRRQAVPASELVLATECGGSDGNSGITANPALGIAADMLVACGGTVILSEMPEIYGAEHLLISRARSPEVANQLLERLQWWKTYAAAHGAELNNNPTPGNKAGGLTTIYEKSLGAVAKGGSTTMQAVYRYAEPVRSRGMVVMDTPGYDPASVTGMVAGGANLIAFTTGRGSCFGCKPVPSLKIATNTPLYERMRDDMDIDAGVILTGTPLEQVGRQIFQRLLEVASGSRTLSEQHGIGDEEFAPWDLGPTL